ncbi:MAG: hypothetical protein ACJ8C4_14920 [Gemmataceae bacterium]
MFEHKDSPLLSRSQFLLRFLRNAGFGFLLVLASLGLGMCGYHHFEGLSWIDAFANAAMILSGMGPLDPLKTHQGKLFAGCYALYSGLIIIVVIGITFAPVVHRFLHKFHLDDEDGPNE